MICRRMGGCELKRSMSVPEIFEGLGMDKSDIERYSDFFINPELASLYIGGLQGAKSSLEDYFNSLHSSFSDYLLRKNRLLSLVLPEEKKDPRVKDILRVVDETLRRYSSKLTDLKVAGLLYGSIYFGDPSPEPDLDFDLVAFNNMDNPNELLENILDEVDSNLLDICQKPCHGSVVYLECHEKKLNNFMRQRYESIINDDYFVMDTSLLLISKRFYYDSCDNNFVSSELNRLESLIENTIKDDSVFRSLVINEFINIENDRKGRSRPVYNDNT